MNNKIRSEKFRKLSVSALITGILPYFFTPVIPLITDPASKYSVYFINYVAVIMYLYIITTLSLTIAAIVCGSIDLRRVKKGVNSSKGKGLDRTGIILGSSGIIYIMFVLIIVLLQTFPF